MKIKLYKPIYEILNYDSSKYNCKFFTGVEDVWTDSKSCWLDKLNEDGSIEVYSHTKHDYESFGRSFDRDIFVKAKIVLFEEKEFETC